MSIKLRREVFDAIRTKDLNQFKSVARTEDAFANDGIDGTYGTYLHYAAENNLTEVATHLIELGADLNFSGGIWRTTPITYAAERGHFQMVRLLRENGGEFDISHPRINPMFMAIEKGHFDVVFYLFKSGLDPHLVYRIDQGKLQNALSLAKDYRQQRIQEFLESHGCRMPIEGVDVPYWEMPKEEWSTPVESNAKIIDYMQRRFGPADELGLQEILPAMEGLSVTINVIQPNELHPYLVLFTNGMSSRSMNTPEGSEDWRFAELVIHLPPDWPLPRDFGPDSPYRWPIEWLRKMAYYPHINKTWLGRPAAIVSSDEPPRALGANTNQSCLLMVPDFANLSQPLKQADGSLIHFFTLVPLYTDERDYEMKYGMKSFFEKFIAAKVPMTVEPSRPSFVSSASKK